MISVKLDGENIRLAIESQMNSNDYFEFVNLMDSLKAVHLKEQYCWILNKKFIDEIVNRYEERDICYLNSYNDIKGIKKINMPSFDLNSKHLDTMKLDPYPFQKVGISYLTSVKKGILSDEMGLGKAQPYGSKVLTSDSIFKNIEDLNIGDSILDTNGKSTTVTGLFEQGFQDYYKLSFSDGSYAYSTLDHLWVVSQSADFERDSEVLKLEQIMLDSFKINGEPKYFIPKLEMQHAKRKRFNNVYLQVYFLAKGYFHDVRKSRKLKKNPSIRINSKFSIDEITPVGTKDDMFVYELNKQRMPILYKNNYVSNKRIFKNKAIPVSLFLEKKNINNTSKLLSILAALIDSSDNLSISEEGLIEGSIKNIHIFNLLKEVNEILGNVLEVLHTKDDTNFYRLRCIGHIPDSYSMPFEEYEQRIKLDNSVRIEKVEKVGRKKCICIKVSHENQMYVTNCFNITHNTPTAIGAAHQLIQEGIAKNILIITPSSLKFQWIDELGKFTDYQGVVIDGTKKKREKMFLEAFDKDINFVITNYETVKNDIELYKSQKWDIIIADECHKIKNKSTQVSKAVKLLKAPYIFGLTGTPMQNTPNELWNIMNWIDKSLLGNYNEFRRRYIATTSKFGKYNVEVGFYHLDEFRKKVSSKILRRMKSDVMDDLPELTIINRFSEMSDDQKNVSDFIKGEMESFQYELDKFNKKNKPYTDSEGNIVVPKHPKADNLLGYLNTLISVSDTPKLLLMSDSKMLSRFARNIKNKEKIKSPKLELLDEIIAEKVENGSDKIVIFTQFKRMADLISDSISKYGKVCRLDGSMSPKQRQESLNTFRENSEYNFFVTTDAGNSGLNMQFADTLINYDLPWNTAVYEQRIGRIHRIGGKHKNVTIINLLTRDSIDESIMKTINKKKETSKQLIEKNDEEISLMKNMIKEME